MNPDVRRATTVPLIAGIVRLPVTFAMPSASALRDDDIRYNVVSGTPFAEISPNETGESPHMLNVTAWGFRGDGEYEDIMRGRRDGRGPDGSAPIVQRRGAH